MKSRYNTSARAGKVAVVVALLLPTVLMPLLAIGVDGGMMMADHRSVQSAVDAAALQAARQLYVDNALHVGNSSGLEFTQNAKIAALDSLVAHGFTVENCEVRTVNIPATSTNERIHGRPGTVEVEVSFLQSRYFSAIWGREDLVVSARSVARVKDFSQGSGVIVLEENDDQALYGRGSGTLIVNGGNISVNSTGQTAADTNGAEIVLAATGFDVAGGYEGGGYYLSPYPQSGTTTPYTNSPPVLDPLRNLPEPNPADYKVQKAPSNGGQSGDVITLQPGRYTKKLFYSGTKKIILEPGVYYLEKGISLQGQVEMQGDEVLLFNAGSGKNNIDLGGGGEWSLSPPTSGTYKDVSIFQSRNTADPSTKSVIRGNGGSGVTGVIYLPTTEALITGTGDQNLSSQFISRTLEVAGSGNFVIDYPSSRKISHPVIELVE